jgi:hypothetical protein
MQLTRVAVAHKLAAYLHHKIPSMHNGVGERRHDGSRF